MTENTKPTNSTYGPEAFPKPDFIPHYAFRFPGTPTAAGSAPVIRVVAFRPLVGKSVPGFTHRVVIDGTAVDWLGYSKPSAKAAAYFLRKHWNA